MPERQNANILLVDDDNITQNVVGNMLIHLGYDFISAFDGHDALEILGIADDFFLVITDINMPRMDGWQLALRLKKLRPRLPIIALTGEDPNSVLPRLADSGIDFALFKPIGVEALRDSIERYVEADVCGTHSSDCR